ncbi:PH domain-containing protein [Histoplasma capsulatum G186AR]|uniref:PH domain-containing protein n=2 Tax=Ajellomyces capsulatus TaxID=5037 RepID=C0NC85_AJECG|nr:PH domain-containing protein [Histoplasma capsulatum G186AR]EEH11276.1 PH domain-containing protein [Histoplasma capsulatum G186AR]
MGIRDVFSFLTASKGNSKRDGSSFASASTTSPASPTPFSHHRHNTDPFPRGAVHSPTAADSASHRLKKSDRMGSRPVSAHPQPQSPIMDATSEAIPELEPVLNYLSSQANKLYQEGYFLKLNDLDTSGRSFQDRQWVDCFAQLVGTVLSIWDSSALDAAGPEGNATPSFINLADASIKMIETLPTRNEGGKPLQNILSISTAGKNRYLLHFSSLHSLTQWTAAIRIAMFENTILQESYTGALIAGKGKTLNGIKNILEKTKFVYEDWARVRFGPGTPWRRCWCVISPPDEKEFQRLKKEQKRKSVYERSAPSLKGNIKFYETKKTKKVKPIATVTDAFSAFAIYPQSRPLIDQSTLVKVEGRITMHSKVESTTDGFIFVLPELHPAISGFEMMLRWLFPVFDTFGLYGRPTKLIADTQNTHSIMFALPTRRQPGYLDILDVAALIHTEGSNNWTEREWRKALKSATAKRMMNSNSRESSIAGSGRFNRNNAPSRNSTPLRFANGTAPPSFTGRSEPNRSSDGSLSFLKAGVHPDRNSVGYRNYPGQGTPPSLSSGEKSLSEEAEQAPEPPMHRSSQYDGVSSPDGYALKGGSNSDVNDYLTQERQSLDNGYQQSLPPAPVAIPPAFVHDTRRAPLVRPQPSPDLHKAGNRISQGTLSQMVDINMRRNLATAGEAAGWNGKMPARQPDDQGQRGDVQNAGSGEESSTDMSFSPQSPVTLRTPKPYSQNPQAPAVDDPTQLPSRPNYYEDRSSVANFLKLDIQKAASRKPILQSSYDGESRVSDKSSSLDSMSHAIDVDALDKIVARGRSPKLRTDNVQDEESMYDQNSTSSPRYASSREPSPSRPLDNPVPQPRMGVLKVVGTDDLNNSEVIIGDVRYRRSDPLAPRQDNPDIPTVDFGPTQVYMPTTRRPSTADTQALLTHKRIPSYTTIGRERRGSSRETSHGSDSKTPSSDEHQRSMIWQPGMVSGPASPGPHITPEEFVQRKVDANRLTSHHRFPSVIIQPRPASGDWTNYQRQQPMAQDMPARPHSRGASVMLGNTGTGSTPVKTSPGDRTNTARPQSMMREMIPRPHSRGASVMLGCNDISTHLSAREQEYVARMTGSSFFNVSSEKQSEDQIHGAGLVSAIDARERDKKAIKEGFSSAMVQQAIAQRQSLQTHFQPAQHTVGSHFPPQHYRYNSSNGMVGGYGSINPHQQQSASQQQQYQRQRQPSWSSNQQFRSPQQQQPPMTTTPAGYRPNPYYQQPSS